MTADPPVLRPAVFDDATALGAVHVAAWQQSYRGLLADGFLDRMSVRNRVARWRQILRVPRPGEATVVLQDRDGLAGFGSVGPQREDDRPADAEVYALYLLGRVQRAGWGRRIMGALARHAAGWGARSLELWVLTGNAGAVAFYEALGGHPGTERDCRFARRRVRERAYVWPTIDVLLAS